jgi:hypothetical protein
MVSIWLQRRLEGAGHAANLQARDENDAQQAIVPHKQKLNYCQRKNTTLFLEEVSAAALPLVFPHALSLQVCCGLSVSVYPSTHL